MADAMVRLVDDVQLGSVEVVAAGPWSARVRVDLSAAVRKALAEQPRAILLDLTGLSAADRALTGAVLLAERQCGAAEPAVPLVVAAPDGSARHLSAAGVAARVPVHATAAEARTTLDTRLPPPSRVQLRLNPGPLASSAARLFVGDTVLAWDLRPLLHPARLIVSELAANAVEHAGTPFTVTASRRGRVLHIAVEDSHPSVPPVSDVPEPIVMPLEVHGNGLRMVAAAALAWGATRTAAGKVVWATLRAT